MKWLHHATSGRRVKYTQRAFAKIVLQLAVHRGGEKKLWGNMP
jgi:hypothetical protein